MDAPKSYSSQKHFSLISIMDLKGRILSVNDQFIEVSGFKLEELVNADYKLVRHPQMPERVFEEMWHCLKQQRLWFGVVKNRHRNGSAYWVDCYITPLMDGKIHVGYKVVEFPPSAASVFRAEQFYNHITHGKSLGFSFNRFNLLLRTTALVAALMAVILMVLGEMRSIPFYKMTLFYLMALPLVYLTCRIALKPIEKTSRLVPLSSDNDICAWIYTGRADELGRILLSTQELQLKIKAGSACAKEYMNKIVGLAQDIVRHSKQMRLGLLQQVDGTKQVTQAIHQMAESITDVANNASQAEQSTKAAHEATDSGKVVVTETLGSQDALLEGIEKASQIVLNLEQHTKMINDILVVIKSVANQTNLLALNAAIEAARAGESGRGFAVVADEVRKLATQTHESTREIEKTITQLQHTAQMAVKIIEENRLQAKTSEQLVENAVESFAVIAGAVNSIHAMNTQIAAAAEQQSQVAHEVNNNMDHINKIFNTAIEDSQNYIDNSHNLVEHALKLQQQYYRDDE